MANSKVGRLGWVVALLGGGLAGAIFTWWVNRPSPTIVTYTVSSTTLAAPSAGTAVPNLRVRIGNEPISALYAHSINLSCPKGSYTDRIEVGVTFPKSVKIFGKSAESQSPLYQIHCEDLQRGRGLRCLLSPLSPDPSRSYLINVVTDDASAPNVEILGKGVELLTLDRFLAYQLWSVRNIAFKSVIFIIFIVGYIVLFTLALRQLLLIRRWRLSRRYRPLMMWAGSYPLPVDR
jgi:hypothetical protein